MSHVPNKEEIIKTVREMDLSVILDKIEVLSHFPKSRKRLQSFRSSIETIYIHLALGVLHDED